MCSSDLTGQLGPQTIQPGSQMHRPIPGVSSSLRTARLRRLLVYIPSLPSVYSLQCDQSAQLRRFDRQNTRTIATTGNVDTACPACQSTRDKPRLGSDPPAADPPVWPVSPGASRRRGLNPLFQPPTLARRGHPATGPPTADLTPAALWRSNPPNCIPSSPSSGYDAAAL